MRAVPTVAFALMALATSSPASADSIAVTSGGIVFDFEGDRFELSGSGFSLSGQIPFVDPPGPIGPHHPVTFANFCFPCRAGDVLDLSFETSGGEQPFGDGPATIFGTSYSEVFYLARFSAHVEPLTIPDTDAFSLRIRQPFVFSGSIRAFTDPDYSTLAFTASLHGRGQTRTHYFRDNDSGGFLPEEGQLVYSFEQPQPVPEPMSLVLIGTGLVALRAMRSMSAGRAGAPRERARLSGRSQTPHPSA